MTVSPLSETTEVLNRPTIGDVAELVRSKHAVPFWQTLDVFLPDDDTYRLVAESPAVNEATISARYGAPIDSITIYRLPTIRVVKNSFPRQASQGRRSPTHRGPSIHVPSGVRSSPTMMGSSSVPGLGLGHTTDPSCYRRGHCEAIGMLAHSVKA